MSQQSCYHIILVEQAVRQGDRGWFNEFKHVTWPRTKTKTSKKAPNIEQKTHYVLTKSYKIDSATQNLSRSRFYNYVATKGVICVCNSQKSFKQVSQTFTPYL